MMNPAAAGGDGGDAGDAGAWTATVTHQESYGDEDFLFLLDGES